MTVLNADMQVEGRGTFLCLLGVCLIAIAAAAAALLWSMEPRLSDHHRSGVRREVGVEPISCNEYSHFKLPAQSAANKHLNSATQHYLTFPWWFKWNCVAWSREHACVGDRYTQLYYTVQNQNGYWPSKMSVCNSWLGMFSYAFYWKEI